jgi:hypothetical protein
VHHETNLSSSASEEMRLFIQEDDGREFKARATNPDFGVRDGHRASVVYVGSSQDHARTPVGLINHSTGNSRLFEAAFEGYRWASSFWLPVYVRFWRIADITSYRV